MPTHLLTFMQLYSPEYVPCLCQVGARNTKTNLLDLASNLVLTNTGQSLGTCARPSQNGATFANCYFTSSGPGIGPHNSFSQVLDTLSYGSSLHYVYRSHHLSGQDNFNDSFNLYNITYEYGFPLNLDYKVFQYNANFNNHRFALESPRGVEKYFAMEVEKEAMAGPFDIKLFTKTHFFTSYGQK